jgi:CHAT domain-containing protein
MIETSTTSEKDRAREELAVLLTNARDREREALLSEHADLADLQLAHALKDVCLVDGWNDEPLRCLGAAAAIWSLWQRTNDPEVAALYLWCDGVAALVRGRNDQALDLFEQAEARFLGLDKPLLAAETQIIKLYALALLGRYDKAIACGLAAREVFIAHGDQLGAGRVDTNIGNSYFRLDRYQEAERFQSFARECFIALGDQIRLARINNCLANTHALLHKFRSAEQLYEQALQAATSANLTATQAEIEGNMGNMALFQGRYDRALDLLERARRKYVALKMPHQSAVSDLEIADAYLELNLVPEAVEIYARVTPVFSSLGMRAEQARALAQHGHAAALLGQMGKARPLLAQARELYTVEGNAVGAATVTFVEAQLHYAANEYEAAIAGSARAEEEFKRAGNWRRLLLARWLRGEALRAAGQLEHARAVLHSTLTDAASHLQPQAAQRCHTSLGVLAATTGDTESAEAEFKQAIEMIETLRAPLPAEEFRVSFFADKLTPYDELLRLFLTAGGRVVEAFEIAERARARALADTLKGDSQLPRPRDEFEAKSLARVTELKEELNWLYNRINLPLAGGTSANVATLHADAHARERELMAVMRQLQHRGLSALPLAVSLDVSELQNELGPDTAFVEYAFLDDQCLAFVITEKDVAVVRGLGSIDNIRATIERVRLQIRSLRYGREAIASHLPQLTERAQSHLRVLYDSLLRPIEKEIGDQRLVIAPQGVLHYVPFAALYDGQHYLVERRSVVTVPSATVLHHCLARPRRQISRALLIGKSDEQTPLVRDEIQKLVPLFAEAIALLDQDATLTALRSHAPAVELLHLACHGHFRPDNPLFSALRLADGWLTVRDASNLKLDCALVTLSACETGVSAVSPGDEIIGLARGLFSAGAPSLLLSLWTVDDQATSELMVAFYSRLCAGSEPAAALRAAQRELLERYPHPFYWAAFVLLGRW